MRYRALLCAALAASPLAAEPRTYQVDPEKSSLRVLVGKSGLFSFAGHEHEVLATSFEGQVTADEAELAKSTLSLEFKAAGLKVSPKGEPPEDVPKVQAKMESAEVLDIVRFPGVTFRSTAVSGKPGTKGGYDIAVAGDLSLHGVTRPLTIPVHVEISGSTLTATGRATLKQSDFEMKPVSVAGVVKVKNELAVEFNTVATIR